MNETTQTTQVVHPVDELLPVSKLLTLGIQHVLVMYAGAIAVPLIIGNALKLSHADITYLISADLFCCGVATLLQCLGAGKYIGIKMPVIMAVTFAAVTPMIAIGQNPELGIQGIFGSTIAAGLICTLLAPLIGKLRVLFPPVVTGVVITSIGLSIMRVGVDWAAGGVGNPHYGAPIYLFTSWAVLAFILIVTRFVDGFFSNIAVLLGIAFGFIIAYFLGEVHFEQMDNAAWFALIKPFAFGPPIFDFWSILTLTIVMMIVFIESMGMFLALGELTGKPVEVEDLNRGLRVDGIATAFAGLFNSFAHSSFSQNVGLVGVTGVKSRYVCAVSGVFLIILGFFPKMASFIAAIPVFVLGGAGIVMFGMVLATGIRILGKVDFQHNRYNSYIIAISLGMGMIPTVSSQFFHQMPKGLTPFLHSGIVIASLWAVSLNVYFNHLDPYIEKLFPKKIK